MDPRAISCLSLEIPLKHFGENFQEFAVVCSLEEENETDSLLMRVGLINTFWTSSEFHSHSHDNEKSK